LDFLGFVFFVKKTKNLGFLRPLLTALDRAKSRPQDDMFSVMISRFAAFTGVKIADRIETTILNMLEQIYSNRFGEQIE